MSDWRTLLSEGSPRGLGKASELAYRMDYDAGLFHEVIDHFFRALLYENPIIKMREASTIEKVSRRHPEWLRPHQPTLLTHLAELSHPFSNIPARSPLIIELNEQPN